MKNSKQPLKMLVLSLTGRCNFACKYCYAAQHPQETMSLETAVRALELAAAGGERFLLQFSGGEPLLAFPLMKNIIQYVRQRQLPAIMQVQTNASLLSPEIAAFLRAARVGVGISLDGRPERNDRLRCLTGGEGTSRKILSGAGFLAAQGVEVGMTCVVSDSNVRQLAGVVEMAYYLGNVRRLGFDFLRAQGRGDRLAAAKPADVRLGVRAALQAAEKWAHYTGKPLLIAQVERVQKLARKKGQGFAHCHALKGEAAFVDARGRIYACSSLVGDEKFRLGDVAAGIDQERLEAVTALIQDSMAFCRQCSYFSLCGGGCFSRWYGSGCSSAYAAECALKEACIEWYQEHRR
ncbi:MAG TPA: radical SAM protein [Desulfitobacteriaceae bacterium]|nr:radical SAM protein [Desulfitobacteriaceae bacterium]